MNIVVKNTLAVVAGFVLGNVVNMGIIMISSSVIPPPAGADVTTMAGLKATMHLFEPKHFAMPFLAHALGTFAGAFLAATLAACRRMKCALGIGILFLLAGIANTFMLPSPIWFTVLDLVGAYIPMAYFAGHLVVRSKSK